MTGTVLKMWVRLVKRQFLGHRSHISVSLMIIYLFVYLFSRFQRLKSPKSDGGIIINFLILLDNVPFNILANDIRLFVLKLVLRVGSIFLIKCQKITLRKLLFSNILQNGLLIRWFGILKWLGDKNWSYCASASQAARNNI